MTCTVITIRPEPGATATVAAARAAGLVVESFPLFEIHPVIWQVPQQRVDALLLGSANAVRHGGDNLARLLGKPAYCVGQATADAARDAGFTISGTGAGGLQKLLDQLNGQHLTLLRLAGADHVPLAAPEGCEIIKRIVYEAASHQMPDGLAARLRGGACVMLHSAKAAQYFADEVDRLGISRAAIRIAALGPRIAAAAGTGWAEVQSAAMPSENALLSLTQHMCQ